MCKNNEDVSQPLIQSPKDKCQFMFKKHCKEAEAYKLVSDQCELTGNLVLGRRQEQIMEVKETVALILPWP